MAPRNTLRNTPPPLAPSDFFNNGFELVCPITFFAHPINSVTSRPGMKIPPRSCSHSHISFIDQIKTKPFVGSCVIKQHILQLYTVMVGERHTSTVVLRDSVAQ